MRAGEVRGRSAFEGSAVAATAEYERRREQSHAAEAERLTNERLRSIAHQVRNLATAAMLALETIAQRSPGPLGPSREVIDRSILGILDLVDRARLAAAEARRRSD